MWKQASKRFFYLSLFLGQNFLFCEATDLFTELMGKRSPWPPFKEELRLHDKQKMQDQYHKGLSYLKEKSINTIPKKIHFIWLGPNSFSDEALNNLRSWTTYHPHWEINFWTDRQRALPIQGICLKYIQDFDFGSLQSYIDESNNWAEKADLMRLMIIYKEGGIYTDHDVLCLRSFDDLASHLDFAAGFESLHNLDSFDSSYIVNNGLILSRPFHPILRETMHMIHAKWEKIGKEFPENDRMSILRRVVQRTLNCFGACAKKHLFSPGYRNMLLPASYINSYQVFSKGELEELKSRGFVYAIHKFKGTWLPKE